MENLLVVKKGGGQENQLRGYYAKRISDPEKLAVEMKRNYFKKPLKCTIKTMVNGLL